MSTRRLSLAVVAVLILTGLVAESLAPASASRSGSERASRSAPGWRALCGDLFWLRTYRAWERREPEALRRGLRLTLQQAPGTLYFWIEGARMLAYDLPKWSPEADAETLALEGLALLEEAREHHPSEAALHMEAGFILVRVAADNRAAAEAFERAARLPGAPPYAGRLAGLLYAQAGDLAVAVELYQELLRTSEPDDPRARRELINVRLAQWERELAAHDSKADGALPQEPREPEGD